jgi:hypothetical protein
MWCKLDGQKCHLSAYAILNTQGLQSLHHSNYTPFTLELNCSGICSQVGGCWAAQRAKRIPSHCLPSQNQVIFTHCLARVQSRVSTRVYDLDEGLNLASLMHVFELDHMKISTPDILAWGLFNYLRLSQIWTAVIRHLSVSGKGSRFGYCLIIPRVIEVWLAEWLVINPWCPRWPLRALIAIEKGGIYIIDHHG